MSLVTNWLMKISSIGLNPLPSSLPSWTPNNTQEEKTVTVFIFWAKGNNVY